jgi:predicted MarR family transcription regulator
MPHPDDPASTSPEAARLSDLEFAIIVLGNGFAKWVVHCAEAAGARGLSALDILVLHAVNQRARDKRLADICLVLNVEDSHTVAYALKKLGEQGYVEHRQDGRDRIYAASADGDALCERYLAVREKALVESLKADDVDFSRLDETARALGRLTRYYAHASRTATVAPRKR